MADHRLLRGGLVRVLRYSDFMPPEIGADGFEDQEVYEQRFSIGHLASDSVPPDGYLPERAVEPLGSRMGGKRVLSGFVVNLMPRRVQLYCEPFLGSGRVFFSKPWRNRIEVVNDVDTDLINFYRYAAYHPDRLSSFINALPIHEGLILAMRQELKEGHLHGLERAAAWYICMRTAFNSMSYTGLGRYASSPLVGISTKIEPREVQLVAARLLDVDLRSTSYERLLSAMVKEIPNGGFFYMDPPYDQTAGYSSWQGELTFGWSDQCRLAEFCEQIDLTGNRFIQTNSKTARLIELYGSFKKSDGSPRFHMITKGVYYSVASKDEARKEVDELIISNYPLLAAESSTGQRSMFEV